VTEFGFCRHGVSFRRPCAECNKPYVIYNRDTREEVAAYKTREEAQAHLARFPNDYCRAVSTPEVAQS